MSADPQESPPTAPREPVATAVAGQPETAAPAQPVQRRSAGAMALAAVKEFVIVIVMALVLSFVVKSWLFQAFFIPSGSMENTLVKDDRVIVNKLVPGIMDVQRGDVIVFEDPGGWLPATVAEEETGLGGLVHNALIFVGLAPNASKDHLIKRVIGLPGDHVVCCNAAKQLLVNGVAITEPYVKAGDDPSARPFDITVPADRVWVMGDHRSDSSDSRFHDLEGTGASGSVPIRLITGRAILIVWPFGHAGWLSDHAATFATVPDRTPSGSSSPSVTGPPVTPTADSHSMAPPSRSP